MALSVHNRLRTGTYRLPSEVSAWDILQKMRGGRPDSVTDADYQRFAFSHMRKIIDATPDIEHDTKGWVMKN